MATRDILGETTTSPRLRIVAADRDTGTPGQPRFRAPVGDRTDTFVRGVLVLSDGVSAMLAVALGWWWATRTHDDVAPFWLLALFVPILLLILTVRKMYRCDLNRRTINEIGPIEVAVALVSVVFLAALVVLGIQGPRSVIWFSIWIATAVLLPIGRLLVALVIRVSGLAHRLVAPTLIVGNGRVAHQIVERLRASPQYGLLPIGLLDVEAPQSRDESAPDFGIPYIGSPDQLEAVAESTGAQNVVIAFSRSRDEVLTDVVHIAHRLGLRVWVVPRMFDTIGERARIEHIGGLPLLALTYTNPNGWQFTVKHFSDRVVAGLGLLLISPLFLTLTLAVRLSSPGPIFFGQDRIGRDGRVFKCLKFRSMRPPRASDLQFELQTGAAPGGVEGVDRRTKIGKLMRATSMDELPQLINVLKGDMSLVGPRPERPEFVDLFEMQIRRYGQRHRVKAGVTGWAQVHGLRGQTSIADRAEWDNYYIENWSLGLDLKILALTVVAVLRGSE
ncbi:MAG: exopolysaccharide biosynthesis polyprenyl glycosylphosphotransferase [Mycobacterium sp.]